MPGKDQRKYKPFRLPNSTERLWTAKDIALRCQVGLTTINHWVKHGWLRPIELEAIKGHRLLARRFRIQDVRKFLKARTLYRLHSQTKMPGFGGWVKQCCHCEGAIPIPEPYQLRSNLDPSAKRPAKWTEPAYYSPNSGFKSAQTKGKAPWNKGKTKAQIQQEESTLKIPYKNSRETEEP